MFNLVVLTGRFTADPELKTTPSGVSVTTFSLAVDRKYKQGEDRQTDFINIVAWRATAELITKHFRKGNLIGIEGSIQTRRYQDKNGNNRTVFEVVADNIQFIESKKAQNSSSDSNEDNSSTDEQNFSGGEANDFEDMGDVSDDDLPF